MSGNQARPKSTTIKMAVGQFMTVGRSHRAIIGNGVVSGVREPTEHKVKERIDANTARPTEDRGAPRTS
jgi:hypothetical protein